MKLEPYCEKVILGRYDKQIPVYFIYFPKIMAIKRVRCVKFTNSYDNSTLSKADNNTKDPESLISYDVEPKVNRNNKGEGKITHYPIWQRKRPDFFVVKNIEFGGVDYCCALHVIPNNYYEAITFSRFKKMDFNNEERIWLLGMAKGPPK